jgi:hypothetical protein
VWGALCWRRWVRRRRQQRRWRRRRQWMPHIVHRHVHLNAQLPCSDQTSELGTQGTNSLATMQIWFSWQCCAWNGDGQKWWVDYSEEQSNLIEGAWQTKVSAVVDLNDRYRIHITRVGRSVHACQENVDSGTNRTIRRIGLCVCDEANDED